MRCSPLFWRASLCALGGQGLLWALFILDEAVTRGTDLFEKIMIVGYGGHLADWMCSSFYTVRSEADIGIGIVFMVPVAAVFIVFYAVVAALAVGRLNKGA
jgi:hypothetical protein